ncbi:hypothetical protein [Azospirillum argentinense]|uniref:hypothetical protein n=1 Tax=Azospirillum argentinense TaxID=2970906 RepID=UPI00158619F6|nr:hypothetical protein [Azospirillum argentinense]
MDDRDILSPWLQRAAVLLLVFALAPVCGLPGDRRSALSISPGRTPFLLSSLVSHHRAWQSPGALARC